MTTRYLKPGRPPKSNKEKLSNMLKEDFDTQTITFRIKARLHEALKIYCVKNKVTARSVMSNLLEDLLTKENLYIDN